MFEWYQHNCQVSLHKIKDQKLSQTGKVPIHINNLSILQELLPLIDCKQDIRGLLMSSQHKFLDHLCQHNKYLRIHSQFQLMDSSIHRNHYIKKHTEMNDQMNLEHTNQTSDILCQLLQRNNMLDQRSAIYGHSKICKFHNHRQILLYSFLSKD